MATRQYIRYPAQNGGTVVSIGLQLPSIFTVTGSPVTGTGTLIGTFNNEPANTVFAGPASGPAATPTFRALVTADLPAGTGTVTAVSATSPLFSSGGPTPNLTIQVATTSQNGYLSSTDWNTFNNKQPAGSYITALTGDATATGPGSVALTLATVNASPNNYGQANQVGAFTVNAKGLVTSASNLPIVIAESAVTNLVSDLAGKQPVGNYITALTGDVTATGPGSVAASLVATTNATITTLSALSLPFTQTTGTVAINRGGTGQVTATPAFNALAPTTTKGDLIVNNGTNNVREAVGTDGFLLTADSGASTGVSWQPPAATLPYYISTTLTTNVTTTPSAPGEYRTYIKNAASTAGTDNAPATGPSTTNGMLIYAVNFASAGTSGQTNRWEIFVGVGKRLQVEFYQTTTRVGALDVDATYVGTAATLIGTYISYDAANGIYYVDTIQQTGATTTRLVGEAQQPGGAANTQPASCYFDILVTN